MFRQTGHVMCPLNAGLDVKQIATRSTEAYIIQVLKHGFLHSDPHAGKEASLLD